MLTAQGEVSTDRADRYLDQLVRHTSQMATLGAPANHRGGFAPTILRVESTDTGAIVDFDQGRCVLGVDTHNLTITVEAEGSDRLHQLQQLVTSRLETIGRRDNLAVRWDQPPPRPPRRRRTIILLVAAAVLAIAAHVAIGAAVLQAPQWTSFVADGLLVVILVKLAVVVILDFCTSCGGLSPGLLDFQDFLGCGWSG
ncbi:MAG: DUF2218 domain-containing protein [Actinophytocola sp.]|uniref:DUF2218 domain-containing protein n=1 Tax=Actinophytocola sp. TaxID=1872138 RepID=UPI00132466E8|nr:DUF2218 domain-containing protein [Actinophytocola sp.]MPZ84307.1 DUF2218 domain-containing protein [Actinophytocola sp.]